MKKKFTVAGVIATTMIVGVLGTTTAFAAEQAGLFDRDAHRESMETIMDNGDYAGWNETMETRATVNERNAERLQTTMNAIDSEADFDKMVEAHKLMQEGKIDEAKAIFDELGLPERPNPQAGERMGEGLGGGEMKGQGQGGGLHRQ